MFSKNCDEQMENNESILQEIAAHFFDQSVEKVIAEMREEPINTMMFSEDCDLLANMWEEVCVQVQEDMGWAWPYYEYLVIELCEQTIRALSQPLHVALTRYVCLKYGISCQPDAISPELVADEVRERVYAVAITYSNERIKKFVALNYPE